MLIALDEHGNRIHANNAIKGIEYFSPIKKHPVVFKRGTIKIPHFALKPGLIDDTWKHDMSEWHLAKQNLFPEENQEIVLTYNEETHRADVLIDEIVYEFQHSSMSSEEFLERNAFYTQSGYKLVWVYDFIQKFQEEKIYKIDEFPNGSFTLKFPRKTIFTEEDVSSFNENLVLFFELEPGKLFEVKSMSNDGRIFTLLQPIDEKELKNTNILFKNKTPHLPEKEGCKTKISGFKNYPKENYICEKTNEFSVNVKHCQTCPYFKGSHDISFNSKTGDVIYCSFDKFSDEYLEKRIKSYFSNYNLLDIKYLSSYKTNNNIVVNLLFEDNKRYIKIYSFALIDYHNNKIHFDVKGLDYRYNKLLHSYNFIKNKHPSSMLKIVSKNTNTTSPNPIHDVSILVFSNSNIDLKELSILNCYLPYNWFNRKLFVTNNKDFFFSANSFNIIPYFPPVHWTNLAFDEKDALEEILKKETIGSFNLQKLTQISINLQSFENIKNLKNDFYQDIRTLKDNIKIREQDTNENNNIKNL